MYIENYENYKEEMYLEARIVRYVKLYVDYHVSGIVGLLIDI